MSLKIKLDDKITAFIILALIAVFSFIFLGFAGFKVMFGMILLYFLPFYLILDNFNIQMADKVFLSFFIGLGIFSIPVYWLGTVISFKLAILISFLFFILSAFILKKFKK
ncbi:hypothetical protein GF323_04435 [Candidatus Woesearchaeota archaeon]|nr:hypothetical protein [Candidatus Woesearchaeota archaeon]